MERFMHIRHSLAIAVAVCIFVIGAALGVGITSWSGNTVLGSSRGIPVYIGQKDGPDMGRPSGAGFAAVLAPVLPAVVSITSSRIVTAPQSPLFSDPFFRRFFGGQAQPQQQREMGLGSGVIVSPDGYILTNNHVVEKSSELKVILADKRQFPGKIVGTDPKTDIAVVKIEATGLPTVTFGDSTKLRVGDYAFAIGDPFGVGETATMGIISATGRNGLDIEDYEDFIQTDASINPGNSGGALLDSRGQLVGINTAILSGGSSGGGSGGNEGIGFAIPINMAKYVMDQILRHGKVERGYIGVGIQEVTPDLAKAFHIPAEKGALVGNVEANSPGAKAGLQRGDVITELNGQPVTGPNDLKLKVGTMAPGASIHLNVDRAGESKGFTVVLEEAPSTKKPATSPAGSEENNVMSGVEVQDLTPDIRNQLNLNPAVKGVVVTNIGDASAAAAAGLQRGDVVEQVNRQPVNSVADYDRLVRQSGNKTLVLLVNRGGNTTFMVVEPE